MIDKLSKTQETPEELGLSELSAFAKTKTGREKVEAEILWQRRIVLSITPLLFGLLGAALILRFNRRGKGFGLFLALVSLVCYYLAALLGEQLARTNAIGVFASGILPVLLTFITIAWLFLSQRLFLKSPFRSLLSRIDFNFRGSSSENLSRQSIGGLRTGILDFDIVTNLLKYFLLTFGFLASIYLIFTAFELWKFAGNIEHGVAAAGQIFIFPDSVYLYPDFAFGFDDRDAGDLHYQIQTKRGRDLDGERAEHLSSAFALFYFNACDRSF